MSGEDAFVQVQGLTKHFGARAGILGRLTGAAAPLVKAVDGVDFTIARGQTLGLVGESGCGKSTVARLSVGLLHPSTGTVRLDGNDVARAKGGTPAALRRRMQMIFQDPHSSMNARWRVRNIIAEPIRTLGLIDSPRQTRARVDELLRLVGLTPADGDKYPHEFSGGQRQRIAIARALSSHPEFLVCDEPTSALDVSVQSQILNLMMDLQEEFRLTYLFISHNLAVVSLVADQVGVMYLGRIVELAPAARLFAAPRHPYTQLLLETVPDTRRIGQVRAPLTGEVPSPLAPPSGCAFHPRCPLAVARCRQERPVLAGGPGGAVACHVAAAGMDSDFTEKGNMS